MSALDVGECIGAHKEGRGLQGNSTAPKRNLKNTNFVDTMTSQVLHDLRFGLNKPLKSADD